MNIVGGRQFVEIPGDRLHELPPLLIRSAKEANRTERAMQMASHVVESEDMLPPPVIEIAELSELLEQRKMELALQLVEHYQGLVDQWCLGDSILEWIRQCEITFETRLELRPLLRPRRLASRQPGELRHTVAGQGRQYSGNRARRRRGHAPRFPPASATAVLLRPVSNVSAVQDR